MDEGRTRRVMRWVALSLSLVAAATLWPLWVPLVLAGWFAILTAPLLRRLERALHGRTRAAATLTVALVLLLVAPLLVAAVSLYGSAVDLVERLTSSADARALLQTLVSPDASHASSPGLSTERWIDLARAYGGRAWSVVTSVAGATASAVIALFVFVYGAFVFLVHGRRLYEWMEERAPIDRGAFARLCGAFAETGRGLVIGNGLTALTQAAIATLAYVALGVPRALLLGLLTMIVALIPSVGTMIVWGPVAAGLALTGRTTAAIVMAAVGLGVIGTVDNVVRPIFSRYGKLNLPTYAILVSVFGGLAVFGMSGILLGPLIVRLAVEALEIQREVFPSPQPPPGGRGSESNDKGG